jgi:hypothetical protein
MDDQTYVGNQDNGVKHSLVEKPYQVLGEAWAKDFLGRFRGNETLQAKSQNNRAPEG